MAAGRRVAGKRFAAGYSDSAWVAAPVHAFAGRPTEVKALPAKPPADNGLAGMASKTIKLLLVEDELDYAHAVKELLSPPPAFHITHVKSFKEAKTCLENELFDVVLLDLMLPDNSGLKTFSDLNEAVPDLPMIVITGLNDETLALRAVREGAQDYLVKGQLDGKMLDRSIRYAIERHSAENELRRKDEFFRLISENVTDLIAVLAHEG